MEVITGVKCKVCSEPVFIRGFPYNCIAFDDNSKEVHICVGSEITGAFCKSCRNKELNLVWVRQAYFHHWALVDKDTNDYHCCPELKGRTNKQLDEDVREEKLRPGMGVLPSNDDIKRIQKWLTGDLFCELLIYQTKQQNLYVAQCRYQTQP